MTSLSIQFAWYGPNCIIGYTVKSIQRKPLSTAMLQVWYDSIARTMQPL
jgi:hypothetical protein